MRKLREDRELSPETIAHFWITATKWAWQYPVIVEGREVAVRFKAFDSNQRPKYWWPKRERDARRFPIYNLDAVQGHEEIYLVAGEPDVWVMHEAGLPAASFLAGEGTIPSDGMSELYQRGVRRLTVIYDLDETGFRGAALAVQIARQSGIAAVAKKLPEELGEGGDVTDLWRRYAS